MRWNLEAIGDLLSLGRRGFDNFISTSIDSQDVEGGKLVCLLVVKIQQDRSEGTKGDTNIPNTQENNFYDLWDCGIHSPNPVSGLFISDSNIITASP